VPAAAVIPAPIAYFSIAVVKKFVVGFQGRNLKRACRAENLSDAILVRPPTHGSERRLVGFGALKSVGPHTKNGRPLPFTLRKFECSKQATLALPIFENHSMV